jgi:hypothetical protein
MPTERSVCSSARMATASPSTLLPPITSYGTTKYRQVYGKSQKEAIQKRDEARTRENSGLIFEAGRTSVGEYLDNWLEESVKGSVKQSTYDSYSKEIRRHVIPAFRRTKLKNLATDQVRNFRRCMLEEGLSTRTVQYHRPLALRRGRQPCRRHPRKLYRRAIGHLLKYTLLAQGLPPWAGPGAIPAPPGQLHVLCICVRTVSMPGRRRFPNAFFRVLQVNLGHQEKSAPCGGGTGTKRKPPAHQD